MARNLSFAVALLGVVLLMGASLASDVKPDSDAYWLAAQRIREGQELYLAEYAHPVEIYRYAPWFAFAWVPLTLLPMDVAYTVWRVLLVCGAIAAGLPLVRTRTPAGITLGILISGLLLSNVRAANVTPLMLGALALALPTRAGPVVLGVAGSLKLYPLFLVAGYVAERRWRDAAIAVGTAGILWLPALIGLRNYPLGFGGMSVFAFAPAAWAFATAGAIIVIGWLAWRKSPWTWLAAGAAIPLTVPRIWLPDAAFTVVATDRIQSARRAEPRQATRERRVPAALPRGTGRRPWWVPVAIMSLVGITSLAIIGPPSRREPILRLELVTDTLLEPVAMAGDPNDADRLYVVERAGQVVVVEDGVRLPEPLLDIGGLVMAEGLEQGLLGIALHPRFAENGRMFLYYTSRTDEMVLAEYVLLDPATERPIVLDGPVLLTIPDPNPYHNGGQLAFGPDGNLYVGVGDGGLIAGGWRDGRDPANLLGKILRIDVDGPHAAGRAYTIPPDNPFAGVDGARAELWAVGLRNPWRFAFDEPSGTLWIADVGQLKWEELDVVPIGSGGQNFGWNMYEGRQCFERESCDPSGVTMPALVYPHDQANCAIVGGLVYRGPEGRLNGQYLAADYCSGRIWTVDPDHQALVVQLDTDLMITSFGQGADGHAYVLSQGGQLLRLKQVL